MEGSGNKSCMGWVVEELDLNLNHYPLLLLNFNFYKVITLEHLLETSSITLNHILHVECRNDGH